MLTAERANNTMKSSGPKKTFFGNAPAYAFFSAPPNVIQKQPATKFPEFSVSNFEKDYAFFNAKYQVMGPVPKTGTLFISHGVNMNYPVTMSKAERTTFETDFVKSIRNIWSKKHQLTLNEPGFSFYQCEVDVSAHVVANPNDAHTVINVRKPKDLAASRPRSNVSAPFNKKNSKTTHTANLDFRDPTKDKDTSTLDPDFVREVRSFDLDSDKINADCKEDIDAIAAFINAIPTPAGDQCRYTLIFTGRASSEGGIRHNKKLSEKRLDAVANALNGLLGMCISWNDVAGEVGAVPGPEYRRVTVGVIDETKKRNTNVKHNVAAHEFGHMVNLGDEYVDADDERFLHDKPRHYDLIKEFVDEDAANEMLVRKSGNIMSAGNEVKRGHYIMFVAAIDSMTKPEIEKATGRKDPKWNII